MPLKLKDWNISLWRVSIELHKFYKISEFTSEEAEDHFLSVCDGIEPECESDSDQWHLYCEVSYYVCDTGSGDSILNDTITMMKDDGINTDELWDGEWEHEKLIENGESVSNYEHFELELGLKTVELKFENGFLLGDESILDNFRK